MRFITELKTATTRPHPQPDELQPQSHTILLKDMFQYHTCFGVVTVVLLKILLFWDVTLHCGVSCSRCFKGAQHLHFQSQAVQELEIMTLKKQVLQPFRTL